jgi:hypothetical protein
MKKLIYTIGAFLLAQSSVLAQADIQIIHNCADPAASMVDVYVNGTILLDDFSFREATAFTTVPSGVNLQIGIAPSNSTSVNDTLKNFTANFTANEKYFIVASGVINPNLFAANPDGINRNFTLKVISGAQTQATTLTNVDFIVNHGSIDAPTVDVIARDVATLVNDAPYFANTPYLSVPANRYILDVTPAAGSPIVASFEADLTALAGGSAFVFASGFLDPTMNQNGPSFGLFAALANGDVITLPAISAAKLQVVHNCADPAASMVDIYVNGGLFLDNFSFRKATPYVEVPAGVVLSIGVAPSTSTSVMDTLVNFNVTLVNGEKYAAIASGVLNPLLFSTNPDNINTAFTLLLQDGMREVSANGILETDIRVIHGCTDAPTVDVLTGGNILVNDAPYKAITPYLSVPSTSYILDITPGNDNNLSVAMFNAPLSGLGGQAIMVIATGFLTPSANQNGASFGLMAVLPDSTVILLQQIAVGIEDQSNINDFNLYPNPTNSELFIENMKGFETSKVRIFNTLGKEVMILNNTTEVINVSALNPGIYKLQVSNEKTQITKTFIVQ